MVNKFTQTGRLGIRLLHPSRIRVRSTLTADIQANNKGKLNHGNLVTNPNNNVPLLPAMLKLEPSKTFGLVDPKAVNYPPIITLIRQRRMKGTTATLKKMTGIKVARMFVDVRLLSQTKTITVVVLPHQLLLLDPQLATVDLVHVDSLRIHGIRIVTTSIMKMMVIGQQLNVTSI